MKEYFKGIGTIPFEGEKSKKPLAFKHYNSKQKVGGKTMEEHLRFSVAYWHTFKGTGSDPFGGAVYDRPWDVAGDVMERAEDTMRAAFEFITKLGPPFYCWHDRDIAPEADTLVETNKRLDQIVKLANGAVAVAGISVVQGSPFDGRTLAELPDVLSKMVYRVAVIRRHDNAIVPTGKDIIQAGDEIFVIAEPKTIEQIGRIASPADDRAQNPSVMLFGDSDLGRNLAAMLQKDCRLKLIGTSKQTARSASEELSRTLVIEGDGHDLAMLEREGLARTSTFIAVSDDDEMNLISCLYAKRIGVPVTIARVERHLYWPMIMTLGADAAVSVRETTVNAILKYIRPGGIQTVARMRGVSAEALEFVAQPGGKIVDRPLQNVRFPSGAMVGMIVRPDEITVPGGDTQIHQGDHVVVFALREAIKKVQKLFA